jgi:hypothetical protein
VRQGAVDEAVNHAVRQAPSRPQLKRVALGGVQSSMSRTSLRSHLLARLVAATFALTGLAACGDLFGPSFQLGTYHLSALNGQPPPFVVGDTTDSTGLRRVYSIGADSFAFARGGQTVRVLRLDAILYHPGAGQDTLFSVTGRSGTHVIRSETVIVTYDNLGVGLPWAPDTLVIEPDGRLRLDKVIHFACTIASCPPPQPIVYHYARR